MVWAEWMRGILGRKESEHLRRGRLGEKAAKRHLKMIGLKFLTANIKTQRGEIDLIFRDDDCLVFVEVKPVRLKNGPGLPLQWMPAKNGGCPRLPWSTLSNSMIDE